jgi:hypothetical protein
VLAIQVPQRAYCAFTFPCSYRRDPPRIDGDLRDWGERYRVPDLMALEGQQPFATLSMAWNDEGLYFGLQVPGKTQYRIDPRNVTRGDCLELWIDTRDVKDSHRANRYCHRFYFLPGGRGRQGKDPIARQSTVERAREQAPPCPEESIQVGLRRQRRGYQMEIALPAAGLNGFQPREFSRLGFNYVLHDVDRGTQSWSIGGDAALLHDPSAWGTVELRPE